METFGLQLEGTFYTYRSCVGFFCLLPKFFMFVLFWICKYTPTLPHPTSPLMLTWLSAATVLSAWIFKWSWPGRTFRKVLHSEKKEVKKCQQVSAAHWSWSLTSSLPRWAEQSAPFTTTSYHWFSLKISGLVLHLCITGWEVVTSGPIINNCMSCFER